jgi:2-dehydropantoate 2-reductase
MKIAVIGAGAIGGLVAGYLSQKEKEVLLICHPEQLSIIKEKGLSIDGARGNFQVNLEVAPVLDREVDLIILAVKTQDAVKTAIENQRYLEGKKVLTTQNGVQADALLSKIVDKNNIISSIVMFGATYLEPGKVMHNFEGSWIVGKPFAANDDSVDKIGAVLSESFSVVKSDEIMAMKYLKIFVNANNCIPAILGVSMQEAFKDMEISKIAVAIWKEGLEIINKSGIKLVSLPDFPLERLTKLTSMPLDAAANIFSGIMVNLSKGPLYGSILQSIKRGRTSEIDYINGEFVQIARRNNLSAPLNEKLVNLVHDVEKNQRFFSTEQLLEFAKEFING